MKRLTILLTTAVALSGCSGLMTSRAPAPVEEASSSAPASASATAAEGTETEGGATVYALEPQGASEIYAYREPEPMVATAPMPSNMPTPSGRPANSAVAALTDQADQQQRTGDYAGAAATLERALRIEPRNPHLWNRLARVRLAQGQFGQANSMAAKSNALAGDNRALKRDNWQLIAQAKQQIGDAQGAAEAQRRAADLY